MKMPTEVVVKVGQVDVERLDAISHPAARLFPPIGLEELREMSKDIKTNRQREPIRGSRG